MAAIPQSELHLTAGQPSYPGTQPLMRERSWIAAIAPAIVAYAVVAVFSGKAIHIDDPIYVWGAKHIAAHPFDFYGFEVNWGGVRVKMYEATKYPPGVSYFLAIVGSIFGWGERALHLGMGFFATLAMVSTYLLAQRLCNQPAIAAWTALSTPVFLVSSTTLMSDMPMLAFYVLAVHLWVTGLDTNRRSTLVAAALTASLAFLTNFFAISAVPLLLAYTIARSRRVDPRCAYLLIPILAAALYTAWVYRLYGINPFFEAAGYSLRSKSGEMFQYVTGTPFIGFVFAGGCLTSAGFLAPALWPRRILLGALVAAVGLVLLVAHYDAYFFYIAPASAAESYRFSAHYVLFCLVGISLIAATVADAARHRDADSLLLAAWLLGTFLFAAVINWSVTARSLLPMSVPAAIVLARRANYLSSASRRVFVPMALSASFALSIWVAIGDAYTANAARRAAHDVVELARAGSGRTSFLGHWGFQYYLEQEGIRFFTKETWPDARPGDRLVIHRNLALPPFPIQEATAFAQREGQITIANPAGVSTFQPATRSGFYSSIFGPLPYTFGPAPDSVIDIFKITGSPPIAGP